MTEYLSLSLPVQGLIRLGFALCTLGMLALSLPSAARFFGTASRRGYLDDGPLLTPLLSPWGRVLVLTSWIAAACWLLLDQHTVMAAAVCWGWSHLFFVRLRWRGVARGMGAPGFMLAWLAALVLALEYTRFYDPNDWLRPLVVLAFKVDFAVIMLCAGQYKMFAGYPQNNGMERGMVSPWWGKLGGLYRKLPTHSGVFRFYNHCAYLGELMAGAMMLFPPLSELGGLFMAASFVFIFVHIRLGFLTHTVITCCLLFCLPGGWVDSLLPPVSHVAGIAATPTLESINLVLAGLCLMYLFALPLAKAGQYYNFYAKKRMPEPVQKLCDAWCNAWGIIIWRVFTIDNTNFYVRVWLENPTDGARTLYSQPQKYDLGSGLRYSHVCEFVCLASVFTTLKYFVGDSHLFSERLRRYAKTIPCPRGQRIVFEWVDIQKREGRFHEVSSREFTWEPSTEEISVRDLQDGSSPSDTLRYSSLVASVRVGSYAP